MIEPSTEETNPRDTVRPEPVPAGGEAEKLSPFEDAVTPLKCDVCGQFVSANDVINKTAIHRMTQPDCAFGGEEWETLCPKHQDTFALAAQVPPWEL